MANRAAAVDLARQDNDAPAAEIAKRPDRFAGFAALPMQVADATSWIDNTELTDRDRRKIGRANAIKPFKLELG